MNSDRSVARAYRKNEGSAAATSVAPDMPVSSALPVVVDVVSDAEHEVTRAGGSRSRPWR
jgi:hypothetical protein